MPARKWRMALAALLGAAVVLVTAGPAAADDKLLLELKQRLDRLEKQNEELRQKLLQTGAAGPYRPDTGEADRQKEQMHRAIDSYLQDKEKQKKDAEAKKTRDKEDQGYEVGKQTDLKGRWTSNQWWFETEDRSFRLHIGGRTQVDTAFVHAPRRMQVPLSQAGIGEFDDGVNFRRARFAMEGTFWEVFDFNCEYDFENVFRFVPAGNVLGNVPGVGNNQTLSNTGGSVVDRQNIANTPVPTDLWIQWSHLPVIGHIRVGNQKPWIGFEHMTSSRFLDFLERSYAFDAFIENGNNGFAPGISAWNTFLDDRLGVAAGVFKPNTVDIYGWNVGDGEYQYIARVWGTPIYEEHGRCLVHLGLSYTHRTADDGRIRYRARTLIRNGNAVLHNTAAIIQANASGENIVAPEFALNYGPFSVSADFYATWADLAQVTNVAGQGTLPAALARPGQVFYHGGYVTVGYFLTGEHRAYNQRAGAWDRQYVNEQAFWVDGEEGWCVGHGAWQVLARYSWLDLDDKNVNGGVMHSATLGLNWFLNPNAKIQFNYEIAHRDVTQYTATGIAANGLTIRDGVIQGFGTRFAFDW